MSLQWVQRLLKCCYGQPLFFFFFFIECWRSNAGLPAFPECTLLPPPPLQTMHNFFYWINNVRHKIFISHPIVTLVSQYWCVGTCSSWKEKEIYSSTPSFKRYFFGRRRGYTFDHRDPLKKWIASLFWSLVQHFTFECLHCTSYDSKSRERDSRKGQKDPFVLSTSFPKAQNHMAKLMQEWRLKTQSCWDRASQCSGGHSGQRSDSH